MEYDPSQVLNDVLRHHYYGKRVFITGHTGFKGSWLCEWLLHLGAEVFGYSLNPSTNPSLFNILALSSRVKVSQIADIRDRNFVQEAMIQAQPDYVFHLAAQPLVRASYLMPVDTWETNVFGTINVLEGLRKVGRNCSAVIVTTDKCYRNQNHLNGYAESDPLGGDDPYSSSKAAAEIAIHSWNQSFLRFVSGTRIASARAGNVIGGGDWAENRIVPDCIRALAKSEAIIVRNPHSIRPFQHVIEPLGAYLWLAAILPSLEKNRYPDFQSFNFGPASEGHRSVADLVETITRFWPGVWSHETEQSPLHEAQFLHLDISKAQGMLGWKPRWAFAKAVERTVCWYKRFHECASISPEQAQSLVIQDIIDYAGQK